LKFFVAVAEALSFTKAADRLHVSQPSVSRQVRELEEELKVPLLARDRQRVRLTEHGQRVLAQARTALAEVAAVAQMTNGASKRQTLTLRVGMGMPLATSLQPLIIEYSRQYPRVEVHYEDVPPELQNQTLRKGEIDVGVYWLPFDRRHLSFEPLFKEGYRVILPRTSPLAQRTGLRLRDLEDETVLLLDLAELSNRVVLHRAHKLRIRLKVTPTTTAPHQAGSALVAAGQGIYILPGSSVTLSFPMFGPEVAVIPLDEPIWREVCLAWRTGEDSATVLDFLETARKVFKKNAGRGQAKPEASPPRARGDRAVAEWRGVG